MLKGHFYCVHMIRFSEPTKIGSLKLDCVNEPLKISSTVTSSKPECKKLLVLRLDRKFNNMSPKNNLFEPNCLSQTSMVSLLLSNGVNFVKGFIISNERTTFNTTMILLIKRSQILMNGLSYHSYTFIYNTMVKKHRRHSEKKRIPFTVGGNENCYFEALLLREKNSPSWNQTLCLLHLDHQKFTLHHRGKLTYKGKFSPCDCLAQFHEI